MCLEGQLTEMVQVVRRVSPEHVQRAVEERAADRLVEAVRRHDLEGQLHAFLHLFARKANRRESISPWFNVTAWSREG